MARRPRKPWRVRLHVPSGILEQTDHASSQAAYEHVTTERQKAERGQSEVTAIRVLQWLDGHWALYERVTPARKTEATEK